MAVLLPLRPLPPKTTRMLERLKGVAGFIFRHPKDAAIIVISLICIFLNWQIGSERREAERSQAMAGSLPPDTKQIITVYRDRVITKWRVGPAKIEYRDRYVPPEGHITLNIRKDDPQKVPELKIKDWGFTYRLGGGVVYSDELLPEADLKWFYFQRYSALVGITPRFGGLGFSRHIDDFIPFHNLELVGAVGFSWQGGRRWGIGLRTNF